MDSTLHDIVNGVMIARVHAERKADAQPQHTKPLNKFSTALERLREEVAATVLTDRKRARKQSFEF